MRWVSRFSNSGIANIFQFAWRRSQGSLSLLIVGLCVAIFLAVAFLGLAGISSRQATMSVLGLSYAGVVQHHWFFQFLTAPLLHVNLTHLLFNMLSLWMLGPGVEDRLGRTRYIVFSMLCALSSMAGSLLLNWGTGSIVYGYSGIIFGILVAQAMYFPDSIIAFYGFFPLKMKYAVLIMGGVELYLTIAPEAGGIAHSAHLFGALAAFLYLRGLRWRQGPWVQNIAQEGMRMRSRWRTRRNRIRMPREL
jgi:membrane associated rhomboid family serine protease